MAFQREAHQKQQHETLGVQILAGVRSEDYWDFQPEQRVMTIDGIPGVVTAVLDGPVPGTEAYQVTLDGGMGGGSYTASQLSPASATTASVAGTAAADYPELGSILVERPDPARQHVYASWHTAADDGEPPFGSNDSADSENDGDSDGDSDSDDGDSSESSEDDSDDDSDDKDDSSDDKSSDGDSDDGKDSDSSPPWEKSAALFHGLVTTAAADADFRFHVTAAWRDVVAKAKKIRSEGRLRVTLASEGIVVAEVKGDHHVYETGLQRLPGRTAAHSWSCGCIWGAYHWGADDDFSRFAGRMCSHALALQYEAMSRGMFGKDIDVDEHRPAWVPRKVVIRYDIDSATNQLVPATAKLASAAPLRMLARAAVAAGEDRDGVAMALRAAGITASWDWDDEDGEDGTHRTDWDRVYPHLNGVHRGMNVSLPHDVHATVHDPSLPVADRAHALMSEMKGSQQGGLGMHWSGSPSQADHYAHVSHPSPTSSDSGHAGTHVILHAATPERDSIETDDSTLRDRQVIGYDQHEDQEVPVREGEPVHITGVSWKEPHRHEWTRHTFEQPQAHTASVGEPFGEPQGTSYQLPHAPGATNKRTPWENPASAGPLAGADPVGWNRNMPMEPLVASLADDSALFEPGGTEATLHDDPEGALPSTDGSEDDMQATAGLRKRALKDFTLAERQALINEGEGATAKNLNRLEITGTQYEELEATLASQEDTTWLI